MAVPQPFPGVARGKEQHLKEWHLKSPAESSLYQEAALCKTRVACWGFSNGIDAAWEERHCGYRAEKGSGFEKRRG